MGLNRIEIQVHAFNDRARAVYRKVGITTRGCAAKPLFHDGRFTTR